LFVSRGGIPLGEIGGHDIRLDPFSFGFFGLIVYMQTGGDGRATAAFLVAIFVAILFHELGHALAISKLVKEDTVIVIGFGGATFHNYIRAPGKQLLVSLAGPFAGLLTGCVAWAVAHYTVTGSPGWPPYGFPVGDSIWLHSLRYFLWASLYWSLFNLVPAIPLDGGHALRAGLLVLGVKARPARRFTRILSVALAVGLGGYAVLVLESLFIGLIAVFVIMAALDEARTEGW
jgi:membrane-associated protease RseP (regulator of RpoE activity)